MKTTPLQKIAIPCFALMAFASTLAIAKTLDLQAQIQPMSDEKVVYAVYQEGELLRCIDSSNGAIVGTINFTGTIIQGPNVSGNRCTVVIDNYLGKRGTVYELPTFNVVTTFDVKN